MSGAAIILFLTWVLVEILAYYDPQAEARERKQARRQMRDPIRTSPTPLPKKKDETEPFGNPEQLDFDLDPDLIRKQERIKREIEAKKNFINNIKLEIN
jgi:hypothetical protein